MADDSDATRLTNGGMATIYVTDMDRAVRFYTETLDLKLQHRAGDYFATIDAGGFLIGLHPQGPHSPTPGTSGSIQIGLNVARSIEDVVDELKRRGVTFRGPIIDDDPVKIAYFGDPDGNDLYLCQYSGPGGS